MRVLVVGAGATLEEAIRLGVSPEMRPPLIRNFSERLWITDFSLPQSLFFFIRHFLIANGYAPENQLIEQFVKLEKSNPETINVEKFFAFSWYNQNSVNSTAWRDLIQGAIISPLIDLIVRSEKFYENGVGWKTFSASQTVSRNLKPGDVVVNLNYEPLFEMGAGQAGKAFTYVPNEQTEEEFLIAKPHGSINLIVEDTKFWFAQPDIIGTVSVPNESESHFRAIVPPREGKEYQQHPIAKVIFDSIRNFEPSVVTFWGVGFTNSDIDLMEIYKKWCSSAAEIEIINPDRNDPSIKLASECFRSPIKHYLTPEIWNRE